VRLRPHHLNCLQGFTGHGYDEAFTARLRAIAEAVNADVAAPVTLVDGLDDVCAACPHATGGACTAPGGGEEAVAAHDAAVLAALGLRAGDVTSFAAVKARLAGDPAARDRVLAWCRDCRWIALCAFASGGCRV
jgi:hypothetical protein